MKTFRVTSIFLAALTVLSLFNMPNASAVEDVSIYAESAILVEAGTGEVLYTKNENARVYPASTTKVMTVLLAVEAIESGAWQLSDTITATENFSQGMFEGDITLDPATQAGEIFTLQELLYSAMLASANEACNIIAEAIGGSISNFVSMMNSRAAELGCTGTNFMNTNGLPNENHYTTAYDMYLITKEALSYELFSQVCSSASYTIPATNMSESRQLTNTNALLHAESQYYYQYCTGVKTGNTDPAGYCLVASASKSGMQLISIVMKSNTYEQQNGATGYGHFYDTAVLFNWAFENYAYIDIIKSTDLIADVSVSMSANEGYVSLRPEKSISALLPTNTDLNSFDRDIVIYSQRDGGELIAPIPAGEKLGEITISRNGEIFGTTYLLAATTVELSKVDYIWSEVKNIAEMPAVRWTIFIVCALLLLYLVLVVRYHVLHIWHWSSVRRARRERDYYRREQADGISMQQYSDDDGQYLPPDNGAGNDIPGREKPKEVFDGWGNEEYQPDRQTAKTPVKSSDMFDMWNGREEPEQERQAPEIRRRPSEGVSEGAERFADKWKESEYKAQPAERAGETSRDMFDIWSGAGEEKAGPSPAGEAFASWMDTDFDELPVIDARVSPQAREAPGKTSSSGTPKKPEREKPAAKAPPKNPAARTGTASGTKKPTAASQAGKSEKPEKDKPGGAGTQSNPERDLFSEFFGDE